MMNKEEVEALLKLTESRATGNKEFVAGYIAALEMVLV
jgi:hypothetical protein